MKRATVLYVWTWHIFNPKIKQKNNFLGISGSSLHLFNWCIKFFFEKRILNKFQIRGDKTQGQQNSWKASKICRLSYEMDRIAVFRIIVWRNNIHFGKTWPSFLYSIILLNECVKIGHNVQPFLYANVPAESPSYAPTFFPLII